MKTSWSNYLMSYVVFFGLIFCVVSQTDTTGSSENVTVVSSTPSPSNTSCESHNDCKTCVANTECFFCESDNGCHSKVTKILTDAACDWKKSHYWTCRVNLQYLVIGIGVFAGIVVLMITIFCCYCCCKKKGIRISKDDIKWARQKEERKQIAAEKREERAKRTDEIRKKYGLVKDSNPYQKFDA